MIHIEQLIQIGKIRKTHGVEGELLINIDPGISIDGIPDFIFCMIDHLPVPFFVKEQRQSSSHSFFVFLESIENVEDGSVLVGEPVYIENHSSIEGDVSVLGVVGLEMRTLDGTFLGTVESLDSSTPNLLFVCRNLEGKEFLIPGVDEFIHYIDVDKRVLIMDLPDGLLSLDSE